MGRFRLPTTVARRDLEYHLHTREKFYFNLLSEATRLVSLELSFCLLSPAHHRVQNYRNRQTLPSFSPCFNDGHVTPFPFLRPDDMSKRHEPSGSSRFGSGRSPPRNSTTALHPSRASLVEARSKDSIPPEPPRGPRALTEPHRGYTSSVSRGRGFSGRADYRTDYRDREYFRRDSSPPGGRRWSPHGDRFSTSDYRDHRDAPRDLDFGRGRRGYHESGASRYGVNGRGGQSYHPSRDDPGRGRGRTEWTPRARGRPSFHDERGDFRGRSRSPQSRSLRRDRSLSRERWQPPHDRFLDSSIDRREVEKSLDRDERPRDDGRFRNDRYLIDSRYNGTIVNAEKHPDSANVRAQRECKQFKQDYTTHIAASTDHSLLAVERGQLNYDEQHIRTSSPPTAPDVPAFGSSQTRNSQRVAPEQKQTPSSPPFRPLPSRVFLQSEPNPSSPTYQHPQTAPLETRPTPISPKPDPSQIAPKAPKAERCDPSPMITEPSEIRSQVKQESPNLAPSSTDKSTDPPMNAPTGPSFKPPAAPRDPSPSMLRSPPPRPRQLVGVPSGPKASVSPLANRQGPSSPGFNPPVGPRVVGVPSSPSVTSVPTGPRAERTNLPNPRPAIGHTGLASWQWTRSDATSTTGRASSVPAKRSNDGERKGAGDLVLNEQSKNSMLGPTDHQHPSVDHDPIVKIPRLDGSDNRESMERETQPGKSLQDSNDEPSGLEEEAGEFDDVDIANRQQKYQQDVSRLQAQMIDLSSNKLRGTSPLRTLNLLDRLSLEDLCSFFDAPRSRKPTGQRNVDQKSPGTEQAVSIPEQSEQPQFSLPLIRRPAPKPAPSLSPSPVGSPEIQALPFLNSSPRPFCDIEALQENLERQENIRELLLHELKRQQIRDDTVDDDLRLEYKYRYREWRRHVKTLDSQKSSREVGNPESTENGMRQSTTETSPPLQTPLEPRRRMQATDYEFEQVLEMSKREAEQKAQEIRERDAANAKPNWELEANVPELIHSREVPFAIFSDTSCLRNPRELCSLWELQPPADDFTKDEHDTMLQNFKDFPKKFGKIAGGLEGRGYKDCINHYYATKWSGQYKPPRDKRRRAKNPRVKTGPNQRPRANVLISNFEDAKPDLYDGDDASAPLNAYTESGRPKRAAAPTFKDKDQGEQPTQTTPAKKSNKGDSNVERTVEKSSRKPRGGPKEPRQRKGRNVALAKRDSKSPEKMDASFENGHPSSRDLEGANSLAALGSSQPPLLQRPPSNAPSFAVEPAQSARPTLHAEAGKIQQVRSGSTTGTSSYWSVHEVDLFPQLIARYGTDWTSIAQEMRNKTHTMIKNYYGRLRNSRPDIEAIANDANERRAKGEQPPTTVVSTPALSGRRSKENIQQSHPRPLAPTPEVIDLDDDDKAASQPLKHVAPAAQSSPLRSSAQVDVKDSRTPHERSDSHQHPRMPLQPPQANFGAKVQAPIDPLQLAHRVPVVTGPTSSSFHHAPTSVPMEYRSTSSTSIYPGGQINAPGQLKPMLEDLLNAHSPHSTMSGISRTEGSNLYGPAPSVPRVISRPPQSERSLSDDAQRIRAASPQPPSSMRHLMDQPASRPQSNPYIDPIRPPASAPLIRDEIRPKPIQDKPIQPPPAQSKPEPRKSNLMSILNNDEPEEPRPRANPPLSAVTNSTPFQYHTAPSSYPPRPSSRVDRAEYPREHSGRVSSLSHPSSFYPLSHQPPRATVDNRPSDSKLNPGTFHIDWPPAAESEPPTEQSLSAHQHRSSLHYGVDPRYNASTPPLAHRESGPGSGTNSPFNQRMPMSHLTSRRDRSPPSVRPYGYAPPPSHVHSRETSISRLHPPPTVLQPQTPSRQPGPPAASQPQPPISTAMPPRTDPVGPSYIPREMSSYSSGPRDISRSVYSGEQNLSAYAHNTAESSYDMNEKSRVWRGGHHEEDREDQRAADWTRGLPREQRYGPVTSAPSQPPQQQPPPPPRQYAPYHPVSDRSRERER